MTANAIRALLDGNPPDGTAPAECGAWGPVLQALADAYQRAGTPGVRAAFDALRAQEPALGQLLAGGLTGGPPADAAGGPPANAAGIKIYEAGDAWLPRAAAPAVVAGLIERGTVTLLFGVPGVGKTWLFGDLAVCVAAGRPWLGMATAQTPVLIVDEESGARRLFERLERTMAGHGLPRGTRLPIAFTSLEGFDLRAGGLWLELLEGIIRDRGAGLVVIDALADVMMGGDENAVRDTQPVFHGLRTVADGMGAAIIVVHHANKMGRYRGSSAIPGAVDLVLGVSACADEAVLKVETVKARDMAPAGFGCKPVWDAQSNGFRLEPAALQRGAAVNGGAAGKSKPKEYVLRFLASCGPAGADMAAIMKNAEGCSPHSARRALYELTRAGIVGRIDGGGARVRGTWAITSSQVIRVTQGV